MELKKFRNDMEKEAEIYLKGLFNQVTYVDDSYDFLCEKDGITYLVEVEKPPIDIHQFRRIRLKGKSKNAIPILVYKSSDGKWIYDDVYFQSKKITMDVKRHFYLISIMNMIREGEYQSSIGRRFGWSKQRLHPHIKRLEKNGLIAREFRSSIVSYKITDLGKEWYRRCISLQNSNIRLHNISFEFKILKDNETPYDKRIEVNNWFKEIRKLLNCTVEKIDSPEKKFIVSVSSLIGQDPYQLLNKASNIARSVMDDYEEKFGIEVELEGRMVRQPHFAISDPVIRETANHIQLSIKNAKVDKSEGYGELEYLNPEAVKQYIEMPERLEKLENHLINQTLIMDKLADNIRLHLEVLTNMNETLKEIRESLK